MICKACGAQLGDGDTVCPQCGTEAVPAEGGIGFWDMLSKPEGADQADSEVPVGSMLLGTSETDVPSGLTPKVKNIIGALGAAAAGGLLVASIMTLNTVQSIHSELQADYLTMQQQVTALETTVSDIAEKTDDTWGVVGAAMTVVSEPVDVTGFSGTTAEPGEALLTMHVTGKPATFSWERRIDGAWQSVEFDAKTGLNEGLGIKLVEDLGEGVSSLVAAGLTGDAAGEYRCVVTDAEGNTIGRAATLTVVAPPENEPAEADDTAADDAATTDDQPADAEAGAEAESDSNDTIKG